MKTLMMLLGCSLLSATSCKDKEAKLAPVPRPSVETSIGMQEAKKLMETQCYLCHGPSKTEKQGRIAPPMIAVKAHYQEAYHTKIDFVEAIVAFTEKPSLEKVKLKGAVRRFGLMPYQKYNSKEVKAIAEYIYDYEIDEPEWFNGHWKKRKGASYNNKSSKQLEKDPEESLEDIGLTYALETKKVLGATLMKTLQKEGPVVALKYCNERAYPLTDSMAIRFNAKIKRVSDRPRNPMNQANMQELQYISEFKKIISQNAKVKHKTRQTVQGIHFFYPIVTNDMCLKCHGDPKSDMDTALVTSLNKLYPEDKAIGYGVNEVRGIWSIIFEQNK